MGGSPARRPRATPREMSHPSLGLQGCDACSALSTRDRPDYVRRHARRLSQDGLDRGGIRSTSITVYIAWPSVGSISGHPPCFPQLLVHATLAAGAGLESQSECLCVEKLERHNMYRVSVESRPHAHLIYSFSSLHRQSTSKIL